MSSSSSSVDDCLVQWLEKNVVTPITSSVCVRDSSLGGRGLYATQPIEKWIDVLEIPLQNVQLSKFDLPHTTRSLLESYFQGDMAFAEESYSQGDMAFAEETILAVALLREKRLGNDSKWSEYIKHLPQFKDMNMPMSWTAQEIEGLKPSFLFQHCLNLQTIFHRYFTRVKDIIGDDITDLKEEEFNHALELVISRHFRDENGLVMMVPYADFMNASGSPGVLYGISGGKIRFVARRDISKGEEVLMFYGGLPNAHLLMNYGFWFSKNEYDVAQVSINIGEEDILKTEKMEIVKDLPDKQILNASYQYYISEVKVGCAKGEGIPLALRAFARIRSCTSKKELKGFEEDAKIAMQPMKNVRIEFRAHVSLAKMIKGSLEEYKKALLQVEARGHGFQALLEGELRVLQSAYDWLLRYCDKLVEQLRLLRD